MFERGGGEGRGSTNSGGGGRAHSALSLSTHKKALQSSA